MLSADSSCLEFLSRKIFFFYFSLLNLNKLLMFHSHIVKISETIEQAELVENLPPSYLPYRFLHNLHSFLLLWEKSEKKNVFCLNQ